jgi:hypothetical protein
LQEIRGRHDCGDPETNEFWFGFETIEQGLLSRFEQELNQELFTREELLAEIISGLNQRE